MGEHTPIPWRTEEHPNPGFRNFIRSGRSSVVAETVSDADAEFICRAVNSHAALVAALKACRRQMQNDYYEQPRRGMEAECAMADAALKLAEDKP
jgi:hypothetical protein